MKQRILFSIALAGLMLGSCSKDAIDGGNGASWNENGEGFISLSLNMPTTSGSASRAAQVDDGVSSEYKVNDAILVLFTGENESSATFNSAYDMGLGNWEKDNDATNQVTTSARIVQKINEITGLESTDVYALVVLNANGVIEATADNGLNVGGAAWTAESKTLADLNSAVANVVKTAPWNESGFLMSNSPLFNAAGGTTAPSGASSTLVKIDDEKIYTTEAQAISNPSASIYVERAQAKVQVNDAAQNKTFTITDTDNNTTTYTYAIKNWDIDNYNTKSKLTREFDDKWASYPNAEDTPAYRFVDSKQVETNVNFYRTYWGKDVNYEAVSTEGTSPFTSAKDVNNIPTLSKKPGEYTYCLENTTGVVPATGKELTRVIISAALAKGEDGIAADFFTINGDRSKIYLKASGEGSLENEIKARILNDEGVKAAAAAASVTLSAESLTFAYSNVFGSKTSGILDNSKDITVNLVNTITDTEGKIQNAINAVLYTSQDGNNTNNFEIDYYKGGICYYQAFIRHFDDDEAKWDKDTDPNQGATDDTKKKYLGRYGVLRNSWYVLNVNSISEIGDSTYPEIPTEPIDTEEFYISVDINIMPWAKREQEVNL